MLKLVAVVYTGILVAVFSVGMLVGNGGSSSPSGVLVPIHGHTHEQIYEVMVPDSMAEMFSEEEGHFSCDSLQLCHISPEVMEMEMDHHEE
ncbi:hypothetical protein LCGC14_1624110 [marine sediment metagenome]|uniref:Uncharacterized protein n=1 Tax=marine sediment metagenome TaxID=412755 RepID=A0A0F9I4K7_9ZZZZ